MSAQQLLNSRVFILNSIFNFIIVKQQFLKLSGKVWVFAVILPFIIETIFEEQHKAAVLPPHFAFLPLHVGVVLVRLLDSAPELQFPSLSISHCLVFTAQLTPAGAVCGTEFLQVYTRYTE